jgi:hypothetical protein
MPSLESQTCHVSPKNDWAARQFVCCICHAEEQFEKINHTRQEQEVMETAAHLPFTGTFA